MLKIRITSQCFTTMGAFDPNDELSEPKYSRAFLLHLVNEAKAGEIISDDYETKIEEPAEVKKPRSSRLSRQGQASKKKTSSSHKKKRQ